MRMFIFERPEYATNEYHTGGGLVIVAESYYRAQEMYLEYIDELNAKATWHTEISKEEALNTLGEHKSYTLANFTYEEELIVFPDSGCC